MIKNCEMIWWTKRPFQRFFPREVINLYFEYYTGNAIVKFLEESVFYMFGVAEYIYSDNEVQFRVEIFVNLKKKKIKLITTSECVRMS